MTKLGNLLKVYALIVVVSIVAGFAIYALNQTRPDSQPVPVLQVPNQNQVDQKEKERIKRLMD
jgi:hypothetical protein